jgi:hypothetical protein
VSLISPVGRYRSALVGGDGAEDVGEAGLLAEQHQLVGLGTVEVADLGRGGDLVHVRHVDVEADREVAAWLGRLEDAHHRGGVALVHDLVEREVAEPAGRLARGAGQPQPVRVGVAVGAAVRLGLAQHHVVEAPEMDLPIPQPQLAGGHG